LQQILREIFGHEQMREEGTGEFYVTSNFVPDVEVNTSGIISSRFEEM
jgi:hypothetical protein